MAKTTVVETRKGIKGNTLKAAAPKARAAAKSGQFVTPKTESRAEAVQKNLGKSQPLRDFLSNLGWR